MLLLSKLNEIEICWKKNPSCGPTEHPVVLSGKDPIRKKGKNQSL